jgi:hypothetical protein
VVQAVGPDRRARGDRRPVVASRDYALTADEIGCRDICCIAAVAVRHYVRKRRFAEVHCLKQIVETYPLPDRIEFRPFGEECLS